MSRALRSLAAEIRRTAPGADGSAGGGQAAAFDVIIIDELCHPSLALSLRQLRRLAGSAKIAVLVHHLRRNEEIAAFSRPWVTFLERRLIAGSDLLIVNSTSTLDEVGRICGSTPPSVIAPPSGRRFDDALGGGRRGGRRAAAPHRPLRVLFVGNVIARKGLHTLIEAAASLNGVSVTAAGSLETDPRYVQTIRGLAARLDVTERLDLKGSVDDSELVELYRSHDVFCVPSQFEGFGIVYLEAMGFGMPAIGGADGGARDIIKDGENGFLVRYRDAASLSSALAKLRDDGDLYAKMSEAARQTYEESPTWDESMSIIEGFISSSPS